MARALNLIHLTPWNAVIILLLGFASLLAALVLALQLQPRSAGAGAYYYGTFSGYAMGNRYGASGQEVSIGYFANHHPSYCPGDPSAQWAYGTHIKATNSQGPFRHPGTGGTFYLTDFYLYDIGDLTCSMGNYWADLYFGRHK